MRLLGIQIGRRLFKPGEKCLESGQYRNTRYDRHMKIDQITMVKGHEFPPGPKGGRWWMSDRTRHID